MKFRVSVAGETVQLEATHTGHLGAVVEVACRYGIVTVEHRPADCGGEWLQEQQAAEELAQLCDNES